MSLRRSPILVVLGLLTATASAAAQQLPVVRPISAGTTAIEMAGALLRDGRNKDAADLLGRWLSEHPNDGRAWQYLGTIHLRDAQRWHRFGHDGAAADGGMLLEFASTAFERAQQLLADSGTVYRVLVGVERATITVEDAGWEALLALDIRDEELPLPPVLAELGENLIGSCPTNGVLVTGSPVETAAVWGRWMLTRERRPDLVLLRSDLYLWDARYRVRMAEELGVPIELELPQALVHASARRPLCLTPAVEKLSEPVLTWRPVRLVLATGPGSAPGGDEPTVHQLALTGLAGSVWSEAARDVYELAARRNRSLCETLFQRGDLSPKLPSIAACLQ
jgi:hypothetical protein